MSVSLDKIKENKDHQMVFMTAELLMMESRLNKMKKMANMETDLRKNKEEFDKLCEEIHQAQHKLKSKKRQMIQQKLTKIHSRQEERQQRNKESNHILAKIKQGHRQRRKRMESLVNEYKRSYDQMYQKKLLQRRQETRLNIQDIHQHEKQYIRSLRKHSNRIKTESLQKSSYRYAVEQQSFQLSMKGEKHENNLMRDKIVELVNRRIEYGNKAERQSIKIKIPHILIQKLKADSNKSSYDKNIDAYNMQKQRHKKPRLDTNFNGDIQETRVKQINRLAAEQASPATEKLKRLRDIVDGYNLQYVNGQVEALDMMCSASIARANLLLKQV